VRDQVSHPYKTTGKINNNNNNNNVERTFSLHGGDLDNPILHFSQLLMTCEMASAGTSNPSLWSVVSPNDHATRHVHNQQQQSSTVTLHSELHGLPHEKDSA
jgi:hypothetical protein